MKDSLLLQHLLHKDPDNKKAFRYNPAFSYMLSVLAEVPESIITQTKIYSRSRIRYIPFYPAHKGGGAITLGNRNWQSITYTENFFSSDEALFGRAAYANKVATWLRMSAHEVGHLNHATRFGSLLIYLLVFMYQYLRYGHDKAPLEKEANLGTDNLARFNHFLNQNYPGQKIEDCLTSNLTEEEKIIQIKSWWKHYRESMKTVA